MIIYCDRSSLCIYYLVFVDVIAQKKTKNLIQKHISSWHFLINIYLKLFQSLLIFKDKEIFSYLCLYILKLVTFQRKMVIRRRFLLYYLAHDYCYGFHRLFECPQLFYPLNITFHVISSIFMSTEAVIDPFFASFRRK